MAKWKTGYAQSAGERIYWESAGEGVPIVICHGAGSSHFSFYQQVGGLASDDIRIIVWDQRGYGNSTLATGKFGISAAADDLTAILQAAGLATEPVHVVGQAMGALVAAKWAISNPDRVLTLALWDGPFAAGNDDRDLVWTLPPGDLGVQGTLENRQVGKTRAVGALFEARDPVGTYLYQTIQEMGNVKPSYAQVFTAAQAEPIPIAGLNELGVPILIALGETDLVASVEAYKHLAALIPRATMRVLEGCGHSPYFETPELWNRIALDHVRQASA